MRKSNGANRSVLPVDTLLDAESLCNLENERQVLTETVDRGEHVVVYGRRNTGKTSLVAGILIPEFTKAHKKSLAIFVDFLGVIDMEDAQNRFKVGLEKALSKGFPTQTYAKALFSPLKNVRPQMSVDSLTGNLDISLDFKNSKGTVSLDEIVSEVKNLSRKYPTLIVMDEFQDLALVKSGVALMRNALQTLPSNLPVIILGSKRHLLSQIFGVHRAPLAGWGRDLEIPVVESRDYRTAYLRYINDRFHLLDVAMGASEFDYLIKEVQGIPEAINVVGNFLLRTLKGKQISREVMELAIRGAIEEKRSRFEEMVARLRANERSVLVAISKFGPVPQIKSRDFLSRIPSVAPTSVLHAVKSLEDLAEIYRIDRGYVVAEPLLGIYLRHYR